MNNNFDDRVNLGTNPLPLEFGTSFQNTSHRETFHTIKYDFKPASVDVNKPGKLEVGSSMQVTVTVPHLEGSGVPCTVYKGPGRDYSKKDCVLIIDRDTNQITLERLRSNIVLKKTRNELPSKAQLPPPKHTSSSSSSSGGAGGGAASANSLENTQNLTQRQQSKTKVSTGVRKNAPINFVPKQSPNIQNSPSYSQTQWNPVNTQQTLPSIPIIGDDYEPINTKPSANSLPTSLLQPSTASTTNNHHHQHHNNHHQQHHSRPSPPKNNLLENGIGEMSTSESSSDSNSSDSGSDSDSDEAPPAPSKPNFNGTALLNEDLRLSDSNSSDSDD